MANGDILACRISSTTAYNGWVAEIDIDNLSTGGTYDFGLGTNNDPSTAKIVFTVTSPGYTAAAGTTTLSREVYGTYWLRKPYPNQTVANETTASTTLTVRVALSEFIYSADSSITVTIASGFYTQGGTPTNATTALSVTNNSTAAYPKCIGHFAVEQRRPVNGTTTVEVVAFQKFGMDQKPVACVVVTAVGATSSHSETATVTSMSLSARGDLIPVYAASLNLSTGAGYTRGELVNINFTAYPWVGQSGAVLDATTDAGASIWMLGPLKWTIMDKMISVVDSGGSDSSGVASTNQATADANPCLTISGALTKIAAQNNSSYSLNRCDGGEVQCKAGTYKVGKYSTQAVTNGYFTICPHSSTNRAGVVFDDYVTSQFQYAYERYYNVTFNRASSAYITFAANTNVLVMENVNFADTQASAWYSGDTNTNIEFLDCTSVNSKLSPGGNDGHSRLNRHNTWTSPSGTGFVLGNAGCVLGAGITGYSHDLFWGLSGATNSNIIVAYSRVYSHSDGYFIINGPVPVSGLAIISNVIERTSAATTPLSEVSTPPGLAVDNVLLWHNTYAGQRFNHENDITAPYVNGTMTNWGAKGNCFNARGDHRADIHDSDATMIGTWTVGYSVGWDGNRVEGISYGGDTDFWGVRSNAGNPLAISPSVAIGYVSDRSRGGTDAGGGDYHLTTSSTAWSALGSGASVLPYDIGGSPRLLTNGAAGVWEHGSIGRVVPVRPRVRDMY